MNNPDHFSYQSVDYSQFRPTYPTELFQFLAKLVPCRDQAWDCATGSGQAAVGLAGFFKKVIATDISAAQIDAARSVKNIEYRIASAEQSGLESECIDLIMVAQALHWFNFDAFFKEAERVLKPGGVLAVVSYQLPRINIDIDAITDIFHQDIVGDYWPPERKYVDRAYCDIPFPLQEITPPSLQIEHDWTLDQFLGYLQSWSAVACFEKQQNQNPVDLVDTEISSLWSAADSQKRVCWPLNIRIGKFDS